MRATCIRPLPTPRLPLFQGWLHPRTWALSTEGPFSKEEKETAARYQAGTM